MSAISENIILLYLMDKVYHQIYLDTRQIKKILIKISKKKIEIQFKKVWRIFKRKLDEIIFGEKIKRGSAGTHSLTHFQEGYTSWGRQVFLYFILSVIIFIARLFIDYPSELDGESVANYNGHLGVSCRNIRICDVPLPSIIASVWELNEAYGGWRLVHRTSLPRIKREDCVRAEHGTADRLMELLASHPTHGDVVFFQRVHLKFLGSLKT